MGIYDTPVSTLPRLWKTWQYWALIYFHASEISFHIQVVGIAHINDDPFVKQKET